MIRRLLALLIGIAVVGLSSPALAAPGPPAYPEYWFDQWGVDSLWAQGVRGGGVTVAVIDTGVSTAPPELAGKVLPGLDLTGEGGDGRQDRSDEGFSHGTAMASIIVASGGSTVYGVAPDARILPIAVPLEQTTAAVHNDRTATAIDWAADHGAKVINMSFGADRDPDDDTHACPVDVQSAVLRALAKGALLVASAGNSGDKGSPVEDPSVCIGVVSAAAVDASGQRAAFSSVHRYNTVAAPGVNVVSAAKTAGDYYVGDGTSQAAALTSGALALIWSAHPHETNEQILDRLFAGLRPAGPAGRDRYYGNGIVDAGASVRATDAARVDNPVWDVAGPFLARRDADVRPPPTPSPAATTVHPVRAERAAPPGPVTATSRWGLLVAGAGLVLLVVWFGGKRVSRRRVRRSAVRRPG